MSLDFREVYSTSRTKYHELLLLGQAFEVKEDSHTCKTLSFLFLVCDGVSVINLEIPVVEPLLFDVCFTVPYKWFSLITSLSLKAYINT